MSLDGLSKKYKALQASGPIPSLLKLADGELAVRTDVGADDVLNTSAMLFAPVENAKDARNASGPTDKRFAAKMKISIEDGRQ